jgi:TolB-like protein
MWCRSLRRNEASSCSRGSGDDLTEELLNSLAKIEGLQVAGRTCSFYFKGKGVDLGTAASLSDSGHSRVRSRETY